MMILDGTVVRVAVTALKRAHDAVQYCTVHTKIMNTANASRSAGFHEQAGSRQTR